MKTYIDYYSAVHWNEGSLILFNEIHEIDPDFNEYEEMEENENGNYPDIYQYFLTSWNANYVYWLKDRFPELIIAYSDKLNMWVLCVDHYGTGWDYVWTECKLPEEVLPTFNEEGKGESEVTRTFKARFMRH